MEISKVIIQNVNTNRFLILTDKAVASGESAKVFAATDSSFPTTDDFLEAALWNKIHNDDNSFYFQHAHTGAYLWLRTGPDGTDYAEVYNLKNDEDKSSYKLQLGMGINDIDSQIIRINSGPGYTLGIIKNTGFVRAQWLLDHDKSESCNFKFQSWENHAAL